MSIILFIIALVLVTAIGSISFVVTLLYYLITLKWKSGFKAFESFSLLLAISLDQLGNVICRIPFKYTMVKRNSDFWDFGDPDQTVSFVLAVNQKRKTLTRFGKWTCVVLDFLDKNHMEKALEKQKLHDLIASERYKQNSYF
jgi:hypothetical protein